MLFFDGFSEYIKGYKSDETFKIIIEASGAMEGSFVLWQGENATAPNPQLKTDAGDQAARSG